MRTKIQAMSDRLLLLHAIDQGNRVGKVDGTFKLMKIPFMAELMSTRKGINTFNYSFYRWTFGPFTTEIYEDADSLCEAGLSTSKDCPKVTEKGERLLAAAADLFAENAKVVQFVDKASLECAPLTFGALKNKVYGEVITVCGGLASFTIAAAPKGVSVLSSVNEPVASFVIDDDWIDTLWGFFNYSNDEMAGISRVQPMAVACASLQ